MTSLEPALNEDEKLLSSYDEVEWVDEVDQYQCTRCHKVLVQHYISNCEHKFCSNCKRVMNDKSHRWRCPNCQEFIKDMGRQDFKFRDKVFKLRLHCPHKKYGCQHICSFKDLRAHLKGCKNPKERALPVPYKGKVTVEMLDRMFTIEMLEVRREMKEMKQAILELKGRCEDREKEQINVNGCTWVMGVQVDQVMRTMLEVEKNQENGDKMLRNDLIEIQKRIEKKDSSVSESVSLSVEENKMKIAELKGKTDTWFQVMDSNDRKNKELLDELRKEVKEELRTKDLKVEQTTSELKTAQEDKWAGTKDRLQEEAEVRSMANENYSQILSLNATIESFGRDLQKDLLNQSKCRNDVDKCLIEISNVNEIVKALQTEVKASKAEVENIKANTDKKMAKTTKKLDEKENKTEIEMKLRNITAEAETHRINNKKEIMEEINRKVDSINEETNEKNTKMTQQVELIKKEVIEESQRHTDAKVNETISPLSKKLDEKITTMEKTTQENQLRTQAELELKLNVDSFILLRNPQMNAFALAENKCNFQPDFIWKINEIKEKLKQTTFEITSETFMWTGYPVQAQAKLEVKQDDEVWVSLCLNEISQKKFFRLKLIPHVYYVLRDQSGNTKHRSRSKTYLFRSPFNRSLTFDRQLIHKSWLLYNLYNVDDSIVIEVYLEPPFMAQMVHSYDGTLVWAIDHYRKRKQMEKEGLVCYHECPYIYSAPKGYRVRVKMWSDGYGEYRGKGLTAEISFLMGEFDADLSRSIPHTTTITLFNRKDPRRNITKTVDKDIPTEKYYFVDMCSDEEIENVIENDTLFFKVTIKPKN